MIRSAGKRVRVRVPALAEKKFDLRMESGLVVHKLHKLFAGALACCMAVLIMTPAASAAGLDPTYDVYQIFTGESSIDENTGLEALSDIKWGMNGTGVEGEYPDDAILEELAARVQFDLAQPSIASEKHSLDVIVKYVDLGSEAFMSGLDLSELSTVTVPSGYYYICNTPGSVGPNDGYTAGITTVSSPNGVFDIIPKAGSVSVSKTVTNFTKTDILADAEDEIRPHPEPDTDMSEEMMRDGRAVVVHRIGLSSVAAEQGDIVDFVIRMGYPENIDMYRNFYAEFEDRIPAGLELIEDSVHVGWTMRSADDSHVILGVYQFAAVRDGSDSDQAVFSVSLDPDNTLHVTTYSQLPANGDHLGTGNLLRDGVVLSYRCKVTADAAVSEPNTNAVQVKWSNDPSELPYGLGSKPVHLGETIVDDTARADVWTPGLIMHLESKSGLPIAGAKFELSRIDELMVPDSDGNMVPGTITECSIRTPVFSEHVFGQYGKRPDGKYSWILNFFELMQDRSGELVDGPGEIDRYDVRDKSTVQSIGSGVLSLTTDENGMMAVTGLPLGRYRLHLAEDVKGYNKLDDIEFEIEPVLGDAGLLGRATDDAGALEIYDPYAVNIQGFRFISADGAFNLLEPNMPYTNDDWGYINMQLTTGIVLPSTGGTGAAAYFAVGTSLVIIAGWVLIVRYKKRGAF